ncbi:hypothetical protein [Streptomyces flaveolus]|uniref:hypothetical protein n=1 Tax=Streptomyces flaveolus TaxID=67297 RepID=UPI0036F8BBDB
MNTSTSDATVPVGAQNGRDGRAMWMYEMRPIVTAAEREAAAKLVQDRNLWLSRQGHDAPAFHVTAFRHHSAEAVGLYEEDDGDEILVGCLLLYRQHAPLNWGVGDSTSHLLVSQAHTAPGRTDRAGWLLTMWLADYAARAGSDWVYAEMPGWHTGSIDGVARLLAHLRDFGWRVLGTGHDPDGHRVTSIRLAAAASAGLTALIHCTVPLHPTATRREPEEGPTQ